MPPSDKIKTIEELVKLFSVLHAEKRKIVHCHGVLDLLHIGHIRYFRQAREMGDVLVVTITPDKDVDKGPQGPAFSEDLRAEAIASLDIVDFVAVNEWPTAEETIRLLRPDVYVKGSDFKSVEADKTGKLALEANVCKEVGAKLAFTTDIVFSSTNLINKFFSSFPDEVREYLDIFRKRYSLDYVIKILQSLAVKKVHVLRVKMVRLWLFLPLPRKLSTGLDLEMLFLL